MVHVINSSKPCKYNNVSILFVIFIYPVRTQRTALSRHTPTLFDPRILLNTQLFYLMLHAFKIPSLKRAKCKETRSSVGYLSLESDSECEDRNYYVPTSSRAFAVLKSVKYKVKERPSPDQTTLSTTEEPDIRSNNSQLIAMPLDPEDLKHDLEFELKTYMAKKQIARILTRPARLPVIAMIPWLYLAISTSRPSCTPRGSVLQLQ